MTMCIIFSTISNVFSSEGLGLCPICFDVIVNDILTLECGHQYHKSCINKWLIISQRCPICQKPVSHSLPLTTNPEIIKLIKKGEDLIQKLNQVNYQLGYSQHRNQLILDIKKLIAQIEEFSINQSKLDCENITMALFVITIFLSFLVYLLANFEA